MPMLDLHLTAGALPAARRSELLEAACRAVLHAEGAPVAPPYAANTVALLHELPVDAVATAAGDGGAAARLQVLTPPGALRRAAQLELVAELTRLVVDAAGGALTAARVWVQLVEAAEGGWGVGGHALGAAEFAGLAAAAR